MKSAHSQMRADNKLRIPECDFLTFAKRMDPQQAFARPKSDVACGRFTVGPHISKLHNKNGAVLILSNQSQGHLRAEFDGVATDTGIQSGVLTFVPAATAQDYDFDGHTTNTILSINQSLLERVAASNPGLGRVGDLEPRAGFLRPALNKLIEEQYAVIAAGEDGWRVLSESIALRIAYELFTAFNGSDAQKAGATPLSQDELSRLVDFIEAEMEHDFDLSDMAAVLGRDVFGFSRAFKAATGESPHQFLIQRRLMRVKELLAHTKLPLAEIAYATGFSNQSHMTASFSKQFGTPPGAYRKAHAS